jgi:transcriptional regulator with XRE-family HTH domain
MNEKVLHEARTMIAGFFKSRREDLGLSLDDMAERTGFQPNTIRNMEEGRFWLSLKQYLIICAALHLFPTVATYEGKGEISEAMRKTWTEKQESDMTIEEALKLKNEKYLRGHNEN